MLDSEEKGFQCVDPGGLSVALASYHLIGSDMPAPATEYPPLCRLFLLEFVPLYTHPIDLGEHSLQQSFG
jgi:hypothetical protein